MRDKQLGMVNDTVRSRDEVRKGLLAWNHMIWKRLLPKDVMDGKRDE